MDPLLRRNAEGTKAGGWVNGLAVVPRQAAANERAEGGVRVWGWGWVWVDESPVFPVQATSVARMSTHDNPFTAIAPLNVLPVTLDAVIGVCARGLHSLSSCSCGNS